PLVRLLEEEGTRHAVCDDFFVCSDVLFLREDLCGLLAVVETSVEPLASSDQCFDQSDVALGILLGPRAGDAENLLRIVLPDVVVRRDRHTDAADDSLLIPGFTHAVSVDRASFE